MYSYKNLSFYYGKKLIYHDINLNLKKGSIYTLVGNNGVGKTTLLKQLYNLNNYKISLLTGKNPFYDNLSSYDNLYYYLLLTNVNKDNINNILNKLNISKYKDTKYKKLSLGTKQKLSIARVLLEDSDIYLFDEPLNGLDPKSINLFINIINDLKTLNKTVIISSHLLKELSIASDYYLYMVNKELYFFNNNDLNKLENLLMEDNND